MNKMRRTLCQSMGGLFGLIGLGACSQPGPQQPQQIYTEEEKQRLYKFRGIEGYELWVDIFNGNPRGTVCLIYDDLDSYVVGGMGVRTSRSIRPPGLFKFLNVSLFEPSKGRPITFGKQGEVIPSGDLIGQWTVPVAKRIPDELLDELRRDPKGGLRIKIRLHREGVLLGWDIERRLNPWGYTMKEINKGNIRLSPAYSHIGGDFKEARPAEYLWESDGLKGLPADIPVWNKDMAKKPPPFWRWQGFVSLPSTMALPLSASDQVLLEKNNLKVVSGTIITNPPTPSNHRRIWEKGWYIHPRTKERIETDF